MPIKSALAPLSISLLILISSSCKAIHWLPLSQETHSGFDDVTAPVSAPVPTPAPASAPVPTTEEFHRSSDNQLYADSSKHIKEDIDNNVSAPWNFVEQRMRSPIDERSRQEVISRKEEHKSIMSLNDEERAFAHVTISKPVKLLRMFKQLQRDISWSMFEELYKDSDPKTKESLGRIRDEIESIGGPFPDYY